MSPFEQPNGLVIELKNVSKVYGEGSAATHALRGIDLAIDRGEFVAVMGPSGSGKSTCMNILGCLDTPTAGTYRFQGVDVGSLSRDQRALLRRHALGFVFQGFNLLNRTSALENVELPLIYRGASASERRVRARKALAAVGPDYVAPQVSAPPAWHADLRGGATADQADPLTLASWWTTLNDPILTDLIRRAFQGNLDLKKAKARVREARARRGINQADLLPTLNATASGTYSRGSANVSTNRGSVEVSARESYSVGLDAGWEVDVFGGVRRSVEAATAELQASGEDLRNVLVSLLGEVALNYIEVRTFQVRLAVAEANLAAQSETYELTAVRVQAGLTTALDLEQAKYNLESTRSQIPTLQSGLEEAKNRLAILLGEHPGAVHAELSARQPIPVPPLEVAVGVPADLLRRRPDVRQAERKLAAQTAQIGVATAELYPKFSLVGSIGLSALDLTNLLSATSRAYSIGPSVSWRLFDAGAVRKNIEVQSALQGQALIQYEAAVLTALEEVENALVAFVEEQRRRESLRNATQAAERAVALAQAQYGAGMVDFLRVLDAQRSLLSLQDQLAQSEGTITSNVVRLYKALGGGWTAFAAGEAAG